MSGITTNSFTRPVTYKVTAADASIKNYTVTVAVAGQSTKDITAFNFNNPSVTGVITGTNITLTVPFGTNVRSLVPTFTITGSSVKVGGVTQVSGSTSKDFTNPVTYTVVAANGSTKSYTVTVTIATNPSKDITAFSFSNPPVTGLINESNITISVPYGTNVNGLVANFTTTGSSVAVGSAAQTSGTTANDFTSPIIYTVTAADASTKTYTVTVSVAPISAKEITAFSFKNPAVTGVITGTNIAVTVPFKTNVNALIANFTTTGSSVAIGSTAQSSGATANNFSSSVVYTVTAADASTQDYKVTVTIAPAMLSLTVRSTGPADGWVLESKENSTLGGAMNSKGNTFSLGDDAQDRQYRSILHFPTYYLPDNAVVTQVVLKIKKQGIVGTDPFNTHQNITLDIRNTLFGGFDLFKLGSLQPIDFQAPSKEYSVGTIQNNPVSGWYSAMLDSKAFPYVSPDGGTQIRLGFQLDDNDDQGEDLIRFYSGDYSGQKDRPQLQIEYYLSR